MRRRPGIKLLLSPALVTPSTRLLAEAVLVAKTGTPIDYVSMVLTCSAFAATGSGSGRNEYSATLYEREWRSPSGKLTPGEHRYHARFDLPDSLPASYRSHTAVIDYVVRVQVAIPWWRDRVETFTVAVAHRESIAAGEPKPRTFATSTDGPRGTTPFMELAIESTTLSAGDVVAGSVSIQNLRGKQVRRIDASLVEMERVSLPTPEHREGRRLTVRVHDGAPREGEPIPFSIRFHDGGTPDFHAGAIRVTSYLEVRAIVAWGEDVVLRSPLLVLPRTASPRMTPGWVAPVGRERRALVWQRVADRAGLHTDPEAERMRGARGHVGIAIRAEQRDADFWLVASLTWPSLGLDLSIGERRWSDTLSLDIAQSGSAVADARLAAHAREHAQAREFVSRDLMNALVGFEEIQVDDVSAILASRGSAHVAEPVDAFVALVLCAVDAIAAATNRIPAPSMFVDHVVTWRAFAERVRGRLELGRMYVHDGVLGNDRVAIGTEWTRRGTVVGTRIQVAIDPPIAAPPTSPDDPALSPSAREKWRDLRARAAIVHVDRHCVLVEVEGKIADPAEVMPIIELAASLRRALAGIKGAGPFR